MNHPRNRTSPNPSVRDTPSRFLPILLACACASVARADFNPVALTPGSYTYDIVVEAGTAQALPYCINVTAGDGTGMGDNTFYEQGLYARSPQQGYNSGLPVHNTTFTSINETNLTYLTPPDYTANNELMVDATFPSGTLAFSSPTTATNLAILCTGGGGAVTLNYTVTHSDGSTDTGTLTLPDWFDGGSTVAWGANGRINRGGGYDHFNGSTVNNNPPYFYTRHITVSGSSPITGVTFDSPSAHHGNFLAVSGNASGSNWTPITLNTSSFNVMGIVPAAIPFPVTATMDNGTNFPSGSSMNTWFEQGFVRDVTGGLPASGSIFDSQSQPSHHYQMGDYSTNNAVLIDQNHTTVNITPVSQTAYSSLAFLTAGANINGQMTNLCIIQHANGLNETNFFLGYDWFDSSHNGAIALYGNGRVSMQNRTVNNVGNSVPYLFETYFTLSDTASPITNIVVKYYSAPSGSSTTYVMAISGSTEGTGPVITSGPTPSTQVWLPGQRASFAVAVTGTAPLTNSWMVLQNEVYVPLTDGVSANGSVVFGSGTPNLVISNLTAADSGTYKFVASNAFGSQEGTATLTVLAPGNSLLWSPNGNSGAWDTATSPNWINQADQSQVVFNTGDNVLFDDTPGVPTTATVSGTVLPNTLTVDSSANNFTINGSGTLTGPGKLIKRGSSTLGLNVPANFTGSASIEGGTVIAGYYVFANASSINITNNATMDFGGSTMVNHTPIMVSGSGVGGKGAIYNTGYDLYGQVLNITLAGDTVFGRSARWDLGAGAQIGGAHILTMDLSGASDPYAEWNSVLIKSNLSGIILTNGTKLGIKSLDTAFENPATMLTVATNGQAIFWTGGFNGSIHINNGGVANLWSAPSPFNGSNLILDEGAMWYSWGNSGDESINSAVTLNGVAHIAIGDHNMIYTNRISGPGGLLLDFWNHAMILSATNTYSGPTIINNGPQIALTGNGCIPNTPLIFFGGSDSNSPHLDVSGRADQTFTLNNGQTLAGIGSINGSLMVSSGATVSPAGTNTTLGVNVGSNPVGTIAAANNVTLGGTTILKLNGSGTNDSVQAGANVTYGGTLSLVNISGSALAAGNSFKLFNATQYSGTFSAITPATPGSGLKWDTNQLTSGIIAVASTNASTPTLSVTRLANGSVVLSGSGGVANGNYYVLTATNVATPLTNWKPTATNTYDASGNFSVTNTVTPGVPQQFYRIAQPQ